MSDNNLIDHCEHCTIGWKSFHHLTKREMDLINKNRYEATFKQGEIMLKQGSPTSSVLFMATGIAKIYMEGFNGKNCIMSIAQPGMMILGPGAFVTTRHSFSVAALTTVQACFIAFDIFKHLVKVNGNFAESMLVDISEKALNMDNRMLSISQKKMPGRLADTLLYFSDTVFKSDEYEMILSRQELGEMTNMAKECVVRILKDLEDSSVIYSDASSIKILDKEKLIQISEKG